MREYKVFRDGTAWCATGRGFTNLQESDAGFGDSALAALGALIVAEGEAEVRRCESIRDWKCGNCGTEFSRRARQGESAPCPHCKAGSQFAYERHNTN